MNRLARIRILIWFLLLAGAVGLVSQSRFSADMSFFLPAHPSPEQQILIEQIQEGAVSRLLMVGIAGGDASQRARISQQLRQALKDSGAFTSLQNGAQESLAADLEFLFRHRYQLSPRVSPERFSEAGLGEAIAASIDLLGSPLGMLFKPYLDRDPTGELSTLLLQLGQGTQPATQAGVWSSRDGQRALLLAQTRARGSDTDGQEAAVRTIESHFETIRQAELARGQADTQLLLSGPGRFAVQARATIKEEILRLTLISSLAIILVLLYVYRSPRLLALGLLPVVSGAVAGIAAVSLVHGTVFGITAGFGAALIGEAVDYSTYYFVQSGRMGLDAWRQRFWPTIRLGVLTSMAGFAALLFSGFPGLSQLGLYSLAGVVTAALVTRYVLPDLAGPAVARAGPRTRQAWAPRAFALLSHLRWPVLALTLAALAYLYVQRAHVWHPDLSALSTVSEAEALRDGQLRADLGAPDSRYLVVTRGRDMEQALQAAEQAGVMLDHLVAEGVIGGYDSPARFLPSQATQARRRQALPEPAEVAARLPAALADQPLKPQRLTPFLEELAQARQAPDLTRADLAPTSLGLAVDALILQRDGYWSVLLPLHPLPDSQVQGLPVARIRTALAPTEALFIDMKGEFDALYDAYLTEAQRLSLLGVAAIALLLALSLRSARQLRHVLLPLAMAVPLVMASLHLLGERLHLLHLIGLLLIVAVGSNYALFFSQNHQQEAPDEETLTSLLVANLTTAIGFGTLALSSVPVLHAIGVTVGPGAILALLLAAMFAPGKARP